MSQTVWKNSSIGVLTNFLGIVEEFREIKVSQNSWTDLWWKSRQNASCEIICGKSDFEVVALGFYFLITSSTNWHIENTTKGPYYRLKTRNSYRRAESKSPLEKSSRDSGQFGHRSSLLRMLYRAINCSVSPFSSAEEDRQRFRSNLNERISTDSLSSV